MVEPTIHTTSSDINLSDADYEKIQRALNYIRIAKLDRTPGLLAVVPQIDDGVTDPRGVHLTTHSFVYGSDKFIISMLLDLFSNLAKNGNLGLLAEAMRILREALVAQATATGDTLQTQTQTQPTPQKD